MKKKIHMVKWNEVTKGVDMGGLGIRDLRVVNKCLLVKWWWKFGSVDKALRKEVIRSKYQYLGSNWLPPLSDHLRGSRVWLDILSDASSAPDLIHFLEGNITIHIGNGLRSLFWSANWFGEDCFKNLFPRLYQLSLDKNGSVFDFYLRSSPSSARWDLAFRRELISWELDQFALLSDLLDQSPVLRFDVNNRLLWNGQSSGQFSVNSVFNWFELQNGAINKVHPIIWKNIAPYKAQFLDG